MREIAKGSIIPNYIVRKVTVDMGNGDQELVVPVKEFDYKSRQFMRLCMTERDLAAPALKEFFERTWMVMNVWEVKNGPRRWEAGRFTPEQYLHLVKYFEDVEYRKRFHEALGEKCPDDTRFVAQYGKAKWPTGGGRNAHSAGKFFFGTEDVTGDLYRTVLKLDPDKMNPRERVSRTAILFGNSVKFKEEPRLLLGEFATGGTAMVSEAYAERVGIHTGDKLWPTKATAVVSNLNITGVDIVLPKDAIKFEEHRQKPLVMASLMGFIPELAAKVRSSVEKERYPKMALDTMQWLYPELDAYLNEDKQLAYTLGFVKRVVEGNASLEEMLSLAEYTDAMGNKAYPEEFQFLLNGQPKEDARVRSAIMKVAGTAAIKALCFQVRGRYGVAVPLIQEANTSMLLMMPPWMLPMQAKGSYGITDVVQVESDWAIGCLGKDYDGDLIVSLEMDPMLKRLGLTRDVFLDWAKPEDQAWAKRFMSLPEKRKEAIDRNVHQVMADGLKSYGMIGVATNAMLIVLDAMRATGIYTRRELQGLYLRLMSTEVQPYVDALKYDPSTLVKPNLQAMAYKYGLQRNGKRIPGFVDLCNTLKVYFNAVRSMDFQTLSYLSEDKRLTGSFYHRLAGLFRGWEPFAEIDLKNVAKIIAAKYPLPEVIDRKRAMSFVQFGQDVEARYKSIMHMVTNAKLALALVARAWEKQDTRFALYVERVTTIRLIDAYNTLNEHAAAVKAANEVIAEVTNV
jgi:hypothetical protein